MNALFLVSDQRKVGKRATMKRKVKQEDDGESKQVTL